MKIWCCNFNNLIKSSQIQSWKELIHCMLDESDGDAFHSIKCPGVFRCVLTQRQNLGSTNPLTPKPDDPMLWGSVKTFNVKIHDRAKNWEVRLVWEGYQEKDSKQTHKKTQSLQQKSDWKKRVTTDHILFVSVSTTASTDYQMIVIPITLNHNQLLNGLVFLSTLLADYWSASFL